jgi:hypothetical protein
MRVRAAYRLDSDPDVTTDKARNRAAEVRRSDYGTAFIHMKTRSILAIVAK